ncbi:protein L-Myc-1a [Neoarius graeffei]|uniref:protein L-Myc-1a n=1 Tax=Neoarius graeffei TaxID=443677 RepID=UPI00298D21BA|nr:protein L-Myc-1a [Neoarius graeffei]XP_060780544.1 protein L-Myc-1a [Neoarius graeffei]XP_060780545.1 protein L-Myc-1a [Neoarius graeffei]XP_060780546.1 protein L-Myc-1a [Neoarius graeffei]XP_060780547.1 protein L-Myc-1a [Neoarius graeffei]XP_060780548.1 protein L-Myc-1a [Neoarius graeffei]
MECDHHQHYFYDEMDGRIEDFFTSTAPSEDIWKKFELLPTPPVSPSRTFPTARSLFSPQVSERSVWASDDYGVLPLKKLDPLDVFGNLSSVVIKDCMWSGGFNSSRAIPRSETHQSELTHVNAPRIQSAARQTDVQVTRCVNPTAVLNLPVSQSKKTPASSGSESRSDSSDDEIDVVTVENRLKKRIRTPITIAVSADPHGPRKKHFHISLHRQQHNYAAPSPESDDEHHHHHPSDDDCDEEPLGKRAQIDPLLLSAPSSSSSSSPASSDSEDSTEQRRNFLERKRRDDLRSRFQMLRNEIPCLSESAKTSKVAILTHATEYLLQLRARERLQAQERKKLRARRQLLLRKISTLKHP